MIILNTAVVFVYEPLTIISNNETFLGKYILLYYIPVVAGLGSNYTILYYPCRPYLKVILDVKSAFTTDFTSLCKQSKELHE